MRQNLISILMPMKDAAPFLEDCLDSILKQTYENWELIIVDDNSSDCSSEIIEEYILKDDRISLHLNFGKGIISALSLAFSKSNGELIHRMDADDVMSTNKLELLELTLGAEKRAIATGNVSYFSKLAVSEGYLDYENWINNIEDYKAEVYRECTIASPNWLVHRSCFESDIKFDELKYPEDYDLVLKWYAKGYEVLKVNDVTHHWREHPQRTSRNSNIYQQESFFRLKLKHFVANELNGTESVQVIGFSEKGKLTNKVLTELEVKVSLFDFHKGRIASNAQIKDVAKLNPAIKTVLTNWPKSKNIQNEIDFFMQSKGFEKGKNYWLL